MSQTEHPVVMDWLPPCHNHVFPQRSLDTKYLNVHKKHQWFLHKTPWQVQLELSVGWAPATVISLNMQLFHPIPNLHHPLPLLSTCITICRLISNAWLMIDHVSRLVIIAICYLIILHWLILDNVQREHHQFCCWRILNPQDKDWR